MSTPLLLAIDQGTTNTKALVVDTNGGVRALHTERVGISFPEPGWAESDPTEVLESVMRVVTACLDTVPVRSVVGVGITNQRESVVAWERSSGTPLGPMVSWQCTRGTEICARITDPTAVELVGRRTGLALDPMFSASKMRWLLDHIPDGQRRALAGEICLGTVDSWLLWNLGGGSFATDMTNASRTLLFDMESCAWHADLLQLFDIPEVALAEIRPSSDAFASCTLTHRGLAADGALIGALLGDSHAALVGHGALFPGAVKASFGTGTSVLAPLDRVQRSHTLSSTIGWSRRTDHGVEAMPAIEGNIYATGAALEWVAGLLGCAHNIGHLESLARSCSNAGGVTFVPALAGLGAPHWDPLARGTITGLTRHAGPPQVARAAFDAVAHQVADVVDEVQLVLGKRPVLLNADGGAIRSELLAATVADLVDVPLLCCDEPEIAALGAAGFAGLQLGLWKSLDELASLPRATHRMEPTMSESTRQSQRSAWRGALKQTLTGRQHGSQ